MKSLKKSSLLLLFILFLIPFKVNAETYYAGVTTNPSQGNTYAATVTITPGETTMGQVLDALGQEHNMDRNDYLYLSTSYQRVDDDMVITQETCPFYSQNGQDYYCRIYGMPIDHTESTLTFNSVPATSYDMILGIIETNYELLPQGYSLDSCNEDYTICMFKEMGMNSFEAHDNIHINYQYDESIKELAEAIIDAGLLNKTDFEATDLELLHWLNYGGYLADYTSSFKNQLMNLNFEFEMDPRGGAMSPYESNQIGFYKFLYNGTLYGVKSFMEVWGTHIIYIPDDADDVLAAINARLEAIFGDDLHLSVEQSTKTINELLEEYGEDPVEGIGDELYYIFTITDDTRMDYGQTFNFAAFKDSSMVNNTLVIKSRDLVTNVSVVANGDIPLDTLINVLKLSSGEDYERILNALSIDDGEVFNIVLSSKSQNREITTLENGKFQVRIPIPEKYNNKTLMVYYVDEENNVEEYEVTIEEEDGIKYAVFETDHFSTYTLAATGNANPETADFIVKEVLLFIICSTILVGTVLSLHNRKKVKC